MFCVHVSVQRGERGRALGGLWVSKNGRGFNGRSLHLPGPNESLSFLLGPGQFEERVQGNGIRPPVLEQVLQKVWPGDTSLPPLPHPQSSLCSAPAVPKPFCQAAGVRGEGRGRCGEGLPKAPERRPTPGNPELCHLLEQCHFGDVLPAHIPP